MTDAAPAELVTFDKETLKESILAVVTDPEEPRDFKGIARQAFRRLGIELSENQGLFFESGKVLDELVQSEQVDEVRLHDTIPVTQIFFARETDINPFSHSRQKPI